ncbi:MAG: hypothetical protein JSS09_07360 [Verrucomicrobia bacterium]|nr:hypothetical protein [Verrucomicrobiota bacterium]
MSVLSCTKTNSTSPTDTWIELSPIQGKSKKVFEKTISSTDPELQTWSNIILDQLRRNNCLPCSDTSKAGAIITRAQNLYETLKKPESPSWENVRNFLSEQIILSKKSNNI